jgi:hypothetical protein
MSQSNTQQGDITLSAAEDLSGKEGYLVQIVDSSNVAEFALPNARTDAALFVLVDGGEEDGDDVVARPLSPDRSARLRLQGTCSPGDILVIYPPDGTNDGKVEALPAAAGTYRAVAIAEEVGEDEQLVKCRPASLGLITVAAA